MENDWPQRGPESGAIRANKDNGRDRTSLVGSSRFTLITPFS